MKSVVLNTLEFPSSRRSATTGSGKVGMLVNISVVTRLPYTSVSFCDDNKGANPIRVASPTSKRLVILGANFRGENWRVAVGLCFSGVASCHFATTTKGLTRFE